MKKKCLYLCLSAFSVAISAQTKDLLKVQKFVLDNKNKLQEKICRDDGKSPTKKYSNSQRLYFGI